MIHRVGASSGRERATFGAAVGKAAAPIFRAPHPPADYACRAHRQHVSSEPLADAGLDESPTLPKPPEQTHKASGLTSDDAEVVRRQALR